MSTPGQRGAPLGYWGIIEGAVANRVSTQDLWSAIREATADPTNGLTGITLMDVNSLRSQAAMIRNAGAEFNRATEDLVISSQMVARAPWSRPEDARNLSPKLQVRFLHTTMKDGVLESNWRTYVHPGGAPATVGDLRSIVDRAGQMLAQDYETDHVNVDALSVLEV